MRPLAYEGFFIDRHVSVSVKPQKDSRKAPPQTTHAADARQPVSYTLAWPIRFGLSIALIAHLLAIASEPFLMFSRSAMKTGTDASLLRRGLGPYVEMLYLDHGYFFLHRILVQATFWSAGFLMKERIRRGNQSNGCVFLTDVCTGQDSIITVTSCCPSSIRIAIRGQINPWRPNSIPRSTRNGGKSFFVISSFNDP